MSEREDRNDAGEKEAERDEDESESDHEIYLILVKRERGQPVLRCAATS